MFVLEWIPDPTLAAKTGDVLISATLVSLSTTVASTFLISYRIYSIGRQDGGSVRRFRHILEIVVESSAVYSLSSVVAAVGYILIIDSPLNTGVVAAESYGSSLAFVISV